VRMHQHGVRFGEDGASARGEGAEGEDQGAAALPEAKGSEGRDRQRDPRGREREATEGDFLMNHLLPSPHANRANLSSGFSSTSSLRLVLRSAILAHSRCCSRVRMRVSKISIFFVASPAAEFLIMWPMLADMVATGSGRMT